MDQENFDVVIVGAGLAGLSCARRLQRESINFLLLDASDRVGGRIKTDNLDGFLLNRGFQVLQTAYPEAQRVLDYAALELRVFAPGAVFRLGGRFHTVADPRRMPTKLFQTLTAPVGTMVDYLRMFKLTRRLIRLSAEEIVEGSDLPTPDFLRLTGFSDRMIRRFFIPFFSGVCLDPEISVSSLVFQYVLKMFALGDISIPARGMEAIPQQVAGAIQPHRIRTETRVKSVRDGALTLESGEQLRCRVVVLATEAPEVERLLAVPQLAHSRGEHCLYFASDQSPIREPLLVINAEGRGPINNLCVPSLVAPSYAPEGRSLISVTVIADQLESEANLERAVRDQLEEWYGKQVDQWELLRLYSIRHALPEQPVPAPNPFVPAGEVMPGIYVCGEYHSLPSIQWALLSGRLAAEAVMAELSHAMSP